MAVQLIMTPEGEYQFSGKAKNITKAKNALLKPHGKMIHNYGEVLTIYPDGSQQTKVNQTIGNSRFVRNHYLGDRIAYYDETKKTLSVDAYKKNQLKELKEEYPFLCETDKFALESAIEHVDAAYQRFFKKKGGFPRFTSKWKPNGNCYTTKSTNNNIHLLIGKDGFPYITLPKIGKVRIVVPKGRTIADIVPQGARVLSATVRRTGQTYTVSLQMERIIDIPKQETIISRKDILAVDLGIKIFGAFGNPDTNTCTVIQNPRWIRLHARRLRRLQKAFARKQYDKATHTGSKNRVKAALKVAKEHRKCANQRKDFHHKLSRKIADSYKIFVCEDLNIKGMMKNHSLAKEIASVSWGSFLTMVEYKLAAKGGKLVKVSRWFPSSQLCSFCGYKNTDVKDLTIREWDCPKCGRHHDRDNNAMANIFKEGVRILTGLGYTITA